MTASISYVKVKSVDLSYSIYYGKTVFFTIENGLTKIYETQTFIETQIFYIIYVLSPTNMPIPLSFEISHVKNKITPAKLIGIVCGSVAVLFATISIVILIIRRESPIDFSDVTEPTPDFDEESLEVPTKEVTNINLSGLHDKNMDDWL